MMLKAKEIWNGMLTSLEVEVNAVTFDVWIKTLEPVNIVDGRIVLLAPSDGARKFVYDKFSAVLDDAVNSLNDPSANKVIIIAPNEYELYKPVEGEDFVADEPEPPKIEANVINPKYNFENFVVGKSNEYMHAAARAVADEPGKRYNPLFIYGGTGLGKTHIMHAIGNAVKVNNPHLKVLYAPIDKFVNEFIGAIRTNRANSSAFRDKYRNIDVLMIDDVQHLGGKEATQEEMFHTFNELYQANKQIVLTSDRPPKEIHPLEERLRSRFEWGLIVDVQAPDLETRIAILQKKALYEKCRIPNEVLNFMAEKMSSNIRDMESLLNKVIFLSKLYDKQPTIEMAEEALKDYSQNTDTAISPDRIIDCVCKYFSVSADDLKGKKRNNEIVEPRQICMYLIHDMLGLPLAATASIFGRDHTTVMHSRDKVIEKIATTPKIKVAVQDIKDMVLKK